MVLRHRQTTSKCLFVSVSAGSAGCGSCLRGRCWVIRLRRAGTCSFALARAPVMSRTHALALPRPSSGPFGQGRNKVARLRNGCCACAEGRGRQNKNSYIAGYKKGFAAGLKVLSSALPLSLDACRADACSLLVIPVLAAHFSVAWWADHKLGVPLRARG